MTLKREIKDAYIEGGASIYVKTHGDAVYVDDNETETLTQRLDNVKDSITEHTSQLNAKVNKTSIVNNCSATEEGFVLDARQGKVLNDKLTYFNVVKPSLLITTNTKTNTTPTTLVSYTMPFNCNALIIGNACINVAILDEFSIRLNKNDNTFGYSLNKLDTGKKEISANGIGSFNKGDIVTLMISSSKVETGSVYPDGALTSMNILLLPR